MSARVRHVRQSRTGPPEADMSRLSLLKKLAPVRVYRAIRRRGIGWTAHHALRRLGALLGHALTGPQLLRINPMDHLCNLRCAMCWLQFLPIEHLTEMRRIDREEGMKIGDYVRLFNGMLPGIQEVNVVGGGEPLLHPDAMDIMSEIKMRRWIGSLISNGTLMNETVSRRMVEMRWDLARISANAGDAATYRLISGADKFDQLRENLKTYTRLRRDAGVEKQCVLAIFHVLQRENIPTMERLFAFAEEVGANYIYFEKCIPYGGDRWLEPSELKRAQELLESCNRASAIPTNARIVLPQLRAEETCIAENRPFIPAGRCSVGFDEVFITAKGDVWPCCFSHTVMGNVREQTFRRIWYGKKYKDFRRRLINGRFEPYCITNRCALHGVLHD